MSENEKLYSREKILRSLLRSWPGKNKYLIRGFYKKCKEEGLSVGRIARLLQLLRTADKYFRNPFDKLTKEDLENYYDYLGKNISLKCKRCGYEWIPRSNKLPKVCPNRKCKSPYWNKDRVRKDKKEGKTKKG